jgi:tetratricopeptide (TPR) repeat protein
MKWVVAAFLVLPAFAECALPPSSPKVQTAQAVFNDLVQAAGNGEKPTLAVVSTDCVSSHGPERGAWYEEKHHRVNLDITLCDVCADPHRQIGGERNCLAFLLGHELAHVFREHYRTSTLVSGFSRTDASPPADAESAALERDADLFGGIYGYRAGYDSLRHAPEVLDAVYRTYKLSSKLKGYPDLEQRKKIAELSLDQLRKLIPAFEMGNLMLVLGEFELASTGFEDLARKFPAREMFNNQGVAKSLYYASLRDQKDLPSYPWVLDSGSRLELAAESRRGETRTATDAELFASAKQAFEEAKRLDPDYVPAYLNLACLFDLNRSGDKHAVLELDDALEHIKAYPALEPAVHLAQQVLATHAPGARREESTELEIPEEDQIADQTASAVLNQSPGVKRYDTYTVNVISAGGRRWAFISTEDKYPGKTSQGAGIETSYAQLEKSYCAADRKCGVELRTATGRYVHFKKARTIFLLDDKDKVVKWFLWGTL